MTKNTIGPESILDVQSWQRKTTRYSNEYRRDFQFAETIGATIINELSENHIPVEIVELVEKAAFEFQDYWEGTRRDWDDRGLAMSRMDSRIQRDLLLQQLIPPTLAEENGLFDRIWGFIAEDRREELIGKSREEVVTIMQNLFDTRWNLRKLT